MVLVDQFEELFRYEDYSGREEAEAFVGLLVDAARENAPIYVAITMRSEYLGACTLIDGLPEVINRGLYLTPRMSRDECRQAIVGPAEVCGFRIEDRLVNKLLNDLTDFAPWEFGGGHDQQRRLGRRADQLPLMQHVLNLLWQRARVAERDRHRPDARRLRGGGRARRRTRPPRRRGRHDGAAGACRRRSTRCSARWSRARPSPTRSAARPASASWWNSRPGGAIRSPPWSTPSVRPASTSSRPASRTRSTTTPSSTSRTRA